MAKITKEKIIGDVELQLTQSMPGQDLELEQTQIALWISNVRNALVAQEIQALIRKGKQVPPVYISREACKQLTEELTDCVEDTDDGTKQRFYFALSQQVVDAEDDGGIVQVYTNELDQIQRTSLALLPMFEAMRFTKTSSQNVTWSRQDGDRIYIKGFKESDVDFNKIIVFYVPKQDLLTMADTDEVTISDLLLPVLIEQVVQIGKLELYGTQSDTENDAKQGIQPVYHRQIQEPVAPQPQQ